jgi:hypothetical protein
MSNLNPIRQQRRFRLNVCAAPAQAAFLALTFLIVWNVSAGRLIAQLPPTQSALIAVAAVDPLNRFVTGLDQENFVVIENGVRRPITNFYSLDSPISLAIISESPSPSVAKLNGPSDDLIQTASLSDGLRQLIASKNQRKVLILAIPADTRGIPAGIQIVQADPAKLLEAAIEVHNQYVLRFQSSAQAAHIEVLINQPRGLPALKPLWKTPF